MKPLISYKYIKLLIKLIIGIASLWFIFFKLSPNFSQLTHLNSISIKGINWLIFVVLLMFVNWGIESWKWKFAIRKEIHVSLFQSVKIIFSSVTVSLITPNRVGEIPVRALFIGEKFKAITTRTMIASLSQLIVTLFVGFISFIIVSNHISLFYKSKLMFLFLLCLSSIIILMYFNLSKVKKLVELIPFLKNKKILEDIVCFSNYELFILLIISFLRYSVFVFQFFLILKVFDINLEHFYQIFLIPIFFLIASIIPTFLLSEIGVRGSVALIVFSTISINELSIVLASILLWTINIALPAILGIFNLGGIKFPNKT